MNSRKPTAVPRRASGRFPRMGAVTPIPGGRAEAAPQWIEALIMPREDSAPRPAAARGRAALYAAGCTESKQFRDDVLHFLQDRHLMGAVKWISEPGSMPLVRLFCTQRVLEQLQQAPQFDAGSAVPLEMYT